MEPGDVDPKEKAAALFANLIMQQANAALMFMGRVKNPETGETVKDLDAARYFIDQIEMLEVKTRGNLAPEEEALLKQTLMTARMAFVETANEKAPGSQSPPPPLTPESATPSATPAEAAPPTAAEDADSKKKFVKKY